MKQSSNGAKKNNAIIIVCVTIVAVAIIIAAVIIAKKPGNEVVSSSTEADNTVLDRGFISEEEVKEQVDVGAAMQEKVAEGMFACRMSMTWTFPDGTSESSNAYVANSESNTHTMYFDVYVDETDELVYSSQLLPVGSEIRGITLEKDLEPGEYPLRVQYTLVDENYEEISTVGFMVTAIVNN